jgi:CheY-like chemotaxis protein
MMLEKEGYEMVEAVDGEGGLRMLEKDKPDLILLDVMMPEAEGWELCKRIKSEDNLKDIPVVMFTIRTSEDS